MKSPTPDSLSLKEELKEKEEQYTGSYVPFAMSLLTDPSYVSGNRCNMFTNHLKQFVNLDDPDYPKFSTAFENMVGEYSTGYKTIEHDSMLYKRIPKFDEPGMESYIYFDFIYDKEDHKYDVIMKKQVEDLTEKFGFAYNTKVMDSFQDGDDIPAGTVLYKTNSYDEEMNYCYGKNALTMFGLTPFIIEDAIIIRKGFAEQCISKESEIASTTINDNDILKNIYGDSIEYKGFPDVGEHTKNKIVASIARIHNDQIMYTLKKENMRTINFNSDFLTYCSGKVIDIDIFCNKEIEEIPDNAFNAQTLKYLRMQQRFYTKVKETCEDIFMTGEKCSEDIKYIYDRAIKILDPNVKYKDENGSVFSNMIIKFHVVRDVGVTEGQKITARCGNKGVTALIVADEEMPFLENGRPFDLIYSTLGMPNRLISFPLFEQSTTFICNRAIELKISKFTNITEKEMLWFDIMTRFNPDEGKAQHEYYKKKTISEKRKFWKDVESGIYTVVNPPLWSSTEEPLYEVIKKIWEDFDWLEPYTVYIRKWGRTIPIMKKIIAGEMYIMKLKQTSKKGFSARSTGGLNQRGLPTKTTKSKFHEELYSDTPVSHSDQELGNETISIDPEITARGHMYLRSSKTGRRKAGAWLATKKDGIEEFPSSNEEKNTNVTIFQALLKTMGVHMVFEDEKMHINTPVDNCSTYFSDSNQMFIGSELEFKNHRKKEKAKQFFESESVFIGDEKSYEDEINKLKDEISDYDLD